jgi:glycine cleavage system H protein
MTPGIRDRWRDGLAIAAIAVLILVMLPVLAAVVLLGRTALLAGALVLGATGLAAYTASALFRDWLALHTEPQVTYKGLRLAPDVVLAPAHTWARMEEDEADVGVDDLAQSVLGPVQQVILPEPGRTVRRGEPLFRLRHAARWLTARSPVNGTVVAVNDALRERPGQVNESPFVKGWVARLWDGDLKRQRGDLLRGTRAVEWFRREVDRMVASLGEPQPVPTLADGGVMVDQLHRRIDEQAWRRLEEAFFEEPPAAGREEVQP